MKTPKGFVTLFAGLHMVTLFAAPADVHVYYEQVKSFGVHDRSGSTPSKSRLMEGSNGKIYGTTGLGGRFGSGTVFALDKATGAYQVIFSFQSGVDGYGEGPNAGVVEGPTGMLYGVTGGGGSANSGVLYRMNKSGGGFSILHHFGTESSDGKSPSTLPLILQGDVLLGTCLVGGSHANGGIFKVTTDGGNYSIIKSFGSIVGDGSVPEGALMSGSGGFVYGTTSFGGANNLGTIYRLKPDGSEYSVIHSFNSAGGGGAIPKDGLIEIGDGYLYGTTLVGGQYGNGTVFRVGPNGEDYVVLKSFVLGLTGVQPQAALTLGSDGFLFGTTAGGTPGNDSIFRIMASGTQFSTLITFAPASGDGRIPNAALLEASDGMLYGTTASGGIGDEGTVFRIRRDGSDFENIIRFNANGSDGRSPVLGLVEDGNGFLYGATSAGGIDGRGTLFRMQADGSSYEVLRHFNDGNINDAPILASDGKLYGTIVDGGQYGGGAIYRIDRNGDDYVVLRSLGQVTSDSKYPNALLHASDGYLYGTSSQGGHFNRGTIFRLALNGSDYTVLKRFGESDPDGRTPTSPLVEGTDGALYGVTLASNNGSSDGTVFKISKTGAGYQVLHYFAGGDGGIVPNPGLVESNGRLFGTTLGGGTGSGGIVYSVRNDGSEFTVLENFAPGTTGITAPRGALTLGWNGRLLGAASNDGENGAGGIFELNSSGTGFDVIHHFKPAEADGLFPLGGFVETSGGWFLGMTSDGGQMGRGTVFRFRPGPNARNDHFDRLVGSVLDIPIAHLLANDSEPDSGALILSSFSDVSAKGVPLEIIGQSLRYSPGQTFNESDSFTYVVENSAGARGTAIVQVSSFAAPNLQSPQLLVFPPVALGIRSVQLSGVPDRAYLIEACQALTLPNWKIVTTLRADSGGAFTFVDVESSVLVNRFYRAVAQ